MTDDRPTPQTSSPQPPGRHHGRYADGKSAEVRAVSLRFDGAGIGMLDEGGNEIAAWPYDDIRLVERPAAGRPVRLRLANDEMARLEIADHAAFEELERLAPDLRRTGARDPAQWRRAAVWTIGLVALFGGLWLAFSRSAPVIAAMMPMAMEERMGRATVEQVSLIFGGLKSAEDLTCRNEDGVRAMEKLTAQLKAVDDSPYRFDVRVLDISVPNAFAAPGGYIVFFRGLIDMAESADEVAGVLGHEIAHVTHRHVTTNMVRSIGFQAFIVPLISGGTMASDMLSGLGQQALQASYTREAEAEADLGSVELLKKAGIKPDSFPGLLRRIEAKYGDHSPADADGDGGGNDKADEESDGFRLSIPDMLATHPPTPDRAASVAEAAGEGGGGPGLTAEEWAALKSICEE